MREKSHAWLVAGIAMLALISCGSEKLPQAPNDPALAEQQKREFVEAMKPQREGRPVIAILALNDATETTDLLLPHAVLTRADVADVVVVAAKPGAIRLYPTLPG